MDTKAAFDREAFEAKLIEWWPQAKGNIVRDGDDYANHFMSYAWWGWKESRAAIEIEEEPKQALPGQYHHYDAFLEGYATGWNRCVEEVASHGIRIKGKTE